MIAPAWRQAIAEHGARWPHLARLGGRGAIRASAAAARRIAHLAGRAARCSRRRTTTREYPSAAVTRTGDAAERARDFWLHLQPMHFMAGLDRSDGGDVARGEQRRARGTGRAGADHWRAPAGRGMQLVTTSQGRLARACRARARRADDAARDRRRESARAGDAAGSRCAGAAPAHDGAADAAARASGQRRTRTVAVCRRSMQCGFMEREKFATCSATLCRRLSATTRICEGSID